MRTTCAILAVFSAAVLLIVAGCPGNTSQPGASTGTVPGSTLGGGQVAGEIAEFLPSAITLDVSELPEDPLVGEESAAINRDSFERVLRASSTVVLRFQQMADRALALAARIRHDMTGPLQTQVQGTFNAGDKIVAYKADLGSFDFNGDGTPDGSGTAKELPIALRIWTDAGNGYERFLCALVSQRPGPPNFGAGQVYVHPGAVVSEAGDVQLYVDYDRTQPAHAWNLAYYSGLLHPNYDVNVGIARVDVRTNTLGGLEKTVRTSQELVANTYGFTSYQSAVHWAVGHSTLLLSASVLKSGVLLSFENMCLDFGTREPTSPGTDPCGGFDTQDMTLLPVPLGGENAFPAAFGEEPSF